ncbi:peptidoglycan-binding protein [Kiloniella sp.]|uniref:peptidoglycan-binding protein n=1 Tax=Kiloniella sp. TaxID=1938587 RepID=UPI003B02BFB7
MSEDKLKSDDGKPASRKSAEKKVPAKPKSTAGTKKTTPATNKTTATNRKIKSTKDPVAKKSVVKPSSKKTVKVSKAAKIDAKNPESQNTLDLTATKTATAKEKVQKDKDNKKTAKPLTAKPENVVMPRQRKGKSITKMATVAAVLFLGVLFIFLKGNDPMDEEEQATTKSPSVQVVGTPNPNASSPYGMRVEQLKEIETLLSSLNLDPGNIDGDIDHDAVAAISLFQEISGLQVDGRPTPDLLVDLKAVEELLKIE